MMIKSLQMSKKDFKIWMLQNNFTQETLAQKLGIGKSTISKYNKDERYPLDFKYALMGLEKEKEQNSL